MIAEVLPTETDGEEEDPEENNENEGEGDGAFIVSGQSVVVVPMKELSGGDNPNGCNYFYYRGIAGKQYSVTIVGGTSDIKFSGWSSEFTADSDGIVEIIILNYSETNETVTLIIEEL